MRPVSEKDYLRNLRVYPVYRLLLNLLIIGPILVPYMLFKGLNYSQIMLLQSISAIAVFFFEIPTGTIADRISRQFSMSLGAICMMVGLSLYVIGHSFYMFVLAEIIFGLGITFNSGADASILYESLVHLDRKHEYQQWEGHSASLIFIGQAIGAIVSSIVYTQNHYLPFWISIAFLGLSIFASFRFKDTERKKSSHTYFRFIWKSFLTSIHTPRLLWTVLFAVLMGFVMRVSFWLYQPYFELVHIDIFWYGMIFAFFNIVAAIASKYVGARYYDKRPRHILLILLAVMGFSFVLPSLLVFPWMIVILAFQQLVRGMYNPTIRFYINHLVKDEERATIHSLVSLAGSIGFAILSPFVGMSLDQKGTSYTYLTVGIITFSGTALLMLLRRMQKAKKRATEMAI